MSVFSIKNLQKKKSNADDKPLIMLVDDEIENISVLSQLLEPKFSIITGLNGQEALELIEEMENPNDIQLIISDQRMPKLTGVELLEKIAHMMPDTIRIILTGYSDTQVIIDSINKARLYKFITKPFDPVELTLTVQRGVEAFTMKRELLKYTNNLEKLVEERTEELHKKNLELAAAVHTLKKITVTDQLTGANNRYFLQTFIDKEVARTQRNLVDNKAQEKRLGVVMLDIDHFKQVNDTHGHDAGDKVLQQFASILKEICRESDWVVRWGGEEFLIVVNDICLSALQALVERIRAGVEAHQFDIGFDKKINITCSTGFVCYPFFNSNTQALSWEETQNIADMALYLAKNNGRNTWIGLIDNCINTQEIGYQYLMKNIVTLVEQEHVSYVSPISEVLFDKP